MTITRLRTYSDHTTLYVYACYTPTHSNLFKLIVAQGLNYEAFCGNLTHL